MVCFSPVKCFSLSPLCCCVTQQSYKDTGCEKRSYFEGQFCRTDFFSTLLVSGIIFVFLRLSNKIDVILYKRLQNNDFIFCVYFILLNFMEPFCIVDFKMNVACLALLLTCVTLVQSQNQPQNKNLHDILKRLYEQLENRNENDIRNFLVPPTITVKQSIYCVQFFVH